MEEPNRNPRTENTILEMKNLADWLNKGLDIEEVRIKWIIGQKKKLKRTEKYKRENKRHSECSEKK